MISMVSIKRIQVSSLLFISPNPSISRCMEFIFQMSLRYTLFFWVGHGTGFLHTIGQLATATPKSAHLCIKGGLPGQFYQITNKCNIIRRSTWYGSLSHPTSPLKPTGRDQVAHNHDASLKRLRQRIQGQTKKTLRTILVSNMQHKTH